MTETYVTYLLWDGCRAPGNLEYNGKLCGQRVREVSFDRDALLALVDEMLSVSIGISSADSIRPLEAAYIVQGYARRIREACGEAVA